MNKNLSPIQFNYVDREDNTSGYHRVEAIQDGNKIGKIDWDGSETGRVNLIHVDEEHRRQGVATALWNEAHSVSDQKGLVNPVHDKNSSMSGLGNLWSKTVK